MEGPLRVGNDRVEKEVLHHLIRPPGLRELVLGPVAAHGVVGISCIVSIVVGVAAILVRDGLIVAVGRRRLIAAGSQQRQHHQRAEQQCKKVFHVKISSLKTARSL